MGNIVINNLSFKYTDYIFKDLNLNINDNWRLGLIGRNGRGKTTFLKILLNELEYEGHLDTSINFKYFPIYPEKGKYNTVEEMLLERNPLIETWKVYRELSLIGLEVDILYREFYTLSGGEQVRILLIELFLEDNIFPLIDEPTNNLDVEGREIVYKYLKIKKGYIIASHDRAFLNKTIDYVLSINKNNIELLKGDIDTWENEKKKSDKFAQEKNDILRKEIKRLDSVAQNMSSWGQSREKDSKDAFDKARAAKHMKRSNAIVKRTERKIEEKRSLINNVENFEVLKLDAIQLKKQVLSLRNFSIIINDKPMFKPISVDLMPSDILFITGKNGIGKTTLIKFLLDPSGYKTIGDYNVNLPNDISFIEQQSTETKEFDKIFTQLSKAEKEKFLYLLFKLGMDKKNFYENRVNEWSDGEKKKIFIAESLLKKNSLFVWDEITNYLDFYVIDQLIETLSQTRPTMICIDHNEHFQKKLATKTVNLSPL
ncbi:ATP-binding cassette domain-containing protein [Staphylococcus agnetis]|uniref:ATP-binding cassette domain-containing protein n=1 Tax=Staphylococcus agnetis TaxID=985762 RepID=UPI000D0241E4|nr:ATP-binding cassette domain-containing protein [Staphylococcus agnetis]MBY7665235.1 ATP-binding cassette domain-containing protein [Staphylococcus agnetis]TRW80408.1 ABC-F family ATP-binding cassette domain-containing protein [Staphylococcus agnetis]